MTDWKTYKGAVPWIAGKQPDKLGYANNPRFAYPATSKHDPCGYWLVGNTQTTETFYHQGNAWVLKAPTYLTADRGKLCIFNLRLYCVCNGYLLRWNDVDAWEVIANPPTGWENNGTVCLVVVHGAYLYTVYITVAGGHALEHLCRIAVGESAWVEVVSVEPSSTYYGTWIALISFNSKLYLIAEKGLYEINTTTFAFTLKISTANYWWFGSSYVVLNGSLYLVGGGLGGTNGGILYRCNVVDEFITSVTTVAGQIAFTPNYDGNLLISALVEQLGSIYAFADTTHNYGSCLLKWDGVSAWEIVTLVGLPYSYMPTTAVSFHDKLYRVSEYYTSSALSVYNPASNLFSVVAPDADVEQDNVESMVEYKDHLYIMTLGKLFEFNSVVETKYTNVPGDLAVNDVVWPMPA